jgi:hypothetical protein
MTSRITRVPLRSDLDFQRQMIYNHRRQRHEKWVAEHQAKTKFDHQSSKVRADLIVNEARRLEKEHLQHQLQYARALVRHAKNRSRTHVTDSSPVSKLSARHTNTSHDSGKSTFNSPSARSDCSSPGDTRSPQKNCACLQAPILRQITPKYRALALLKQTFEHDKVEEAWETLRETYASDHDMLEDLIYRYGPEPAEVSPMTRLRCAEEKVDECDNKWRRIGSAVEEEMRYRDAFPTVIRNLSIMRVFLEGSQSPHYGCDTSERARRDAFHQQVLDQLAMERALFITPRKGRAEH